MESGLAWVQIASLSLYLADEHGRVGFAVSPVPFFWLRTVSPFSSGDRRWWLKVLQSTEMSDREVERSLLSEDEDWAILACNDLG